MAKQSFDYMIQSWQVFSCIYELTFERPFHVFLCWFRVIPEYCVHGHHHSRSTKAALDSVVLHHALLHGNISCLFFYQSRYFSFYNFFILIETQVDFKEVRTYLRNWTSFVKKKYYHKIEM